MPISRSQLRASTFVRAPADARARGGAGLLFLLGRRRFGDLIGAKFVLGADPAKTGPQTENWLPDRFRDPIGRPPMRRLGGDLHVAPTLIPRRDYIADVCSSPLARTRRDWLLRRVQD